MEFQGKIYRREMTKLLLFPFLRFRFSFIMLKMSSTTLFIGEKLQNLMKNECVQEPTIFENIGKVTETCTNSQ